MSAMVSYWKCEMCDATYNKYMSFGHPENPIDYVWTCPKCGNQNAYPVSALGSTKIYNRAEYEKLERVKIVDSSDWEWAFAGCCQKETEESK